MNIDIKSLEIFSELATELHFAKVAASFHMSPSTLSRKISRIEEEFGCQLFIRDNRTVALTHAGKQLLGFAREQLNQWQQMRTSLAKTHEALNGRLQVYCSVTAAYSHLPSMIDKFRRQHPHVEIALITGDANVAVDQVLQNKADVAIAAYAQNTASSLYIHHLSEIPLAIIAPTVPCQVSEQLKDFPNVDWSQIPVILPDHGLARKRFDAWYRTHKMGKANVYAEVTGHEALVSMVALGCGIGIAPDVVIDNSPVKDRIRVLNTEHQFKPLSLGMCCLKSRLTNPVISAFIDSL